jgi:hypothetical protein
MKIFREKGGVISEDPIWVCFSGPYMYTADTLWQLLKIVVKEWKNDRHLIG